MALSELEKSMEEDAKALAALANGGEEESAPEPEAEDSAEGEDEDAGEGEGTAKPAEKPANDAKADEEEEPKDDVKPDAAAFAKARREKRAKEAENAQLRKELEELRAARTAPVQSTVAQPTAKVDAIVDAEPNKATDYEAWLEWKDRQIEAKNAALEADLGDIKKWRNEQETQTKEQNQFQAAVTEFLDIENKYRQSNPDYGNAIGFAVNKYREAAKVMYPDKTEAQIVEAIDKQMLQQAAVFASKGLNPAEELYDLAIERFGYVPKSAAAEEETTDTEAQVTQQTRPTPAKPKLAVINANKKKSASPLSGGGQAGSSQLTAEDLDNMSNAQFAALTPAQLRELEAATA